MKRLIAFTIAVIAMVIVAPAASDTASAASGDGIKWEKTSHDFGTIHASAGKVTARYTFVNTSGEPVAITAMTNGGCGCTEPAFPRKPVAAGDKGTVTVTFDPSRFKGEIKRQVTVTIMVGKKRIKSRLKFSGHIIPD